MENKVLKYKEEFEKIKEDSTINNDKKALKYAELMTKLEQDFNISMLQEFNSSVPADVINLYQEISLAREI